jgi:hypothetical protein
MRIQTVVDRNRGAIRGNRLVLTTNAVVHGVCGVSQGRDGIGRLRMHTAELDDLVDAGEIFPRRSNRR